MEVFGRSNILKIDTSLRYCIMSYLYMCQGLNSHYFHIIGDGHQPNSRGLYTQYKDSVIKGGRSPIPNIAIFDHGTYIYIYATPPPRSTFFGVFWLYICAFADSIGRWALLKKLKWLNICSRHRWPGEGVWLAWLHHMDLHGHPFFVHKQDSTEVSPLLLHKTLKKMLHKLPSLGPEIVAPHPVLVLGTPNACA